MTLVIADCFDISRASPFRRESSATSRSASDARLRPLRSATFARPTNPPVIAANAGYVFFHCARHNLGTS
jgi:hypothetical protein